MSTQVNVMPNGRMSLPADIRKRVGLAKGGVLVIEERDDGLVLRTIAQAVAHAQAMSRSLLADTEGSTVGDFLAERARWRD